MTDPSNSSDPYEAILYGSYTEIEIAEILLLMASWDQATYPTLSASVVKHADKHGFSGD